MDCLHKVWILTLSGQSMDCLLNPRIEHAQSTDWGNPWIVCSIQGLSMLKVRIGAIHEYWCPNKGMVSSVAQLGEDY